MTVSVEDYLRRLELTGVEPASAVYLRKLHERHMLLVPFENIDVADGVPITLDEDRILDKIVTRRRGGFCYELNAAFAWLLRATGFEVALLAARVKTPEGGFSALATDHMCLHVVFDGDWLCDVGFGDGFQTPLALDSTDEQVRLDERFRIVAAGDGKIYERYVRKQHGFEPQYRFTTTPMALSDFQEGCEFHQSSPDSHFTGKVVCTVAIPDGRITLLRDRMILTRQGGRSETPVNSDDEWRRLLARHFKIARTEPLPPPPR